MLLKRLGLIFTLPFGTLVILHSFVMRSDNGAIWWEAFRCVWFDRPFTKRVEDFLIS